MNNTAKDTFTNIFNSGAWHGDWETQDGIGSGLWYTQTIRSQLPDLLKKFNVTSFLDASCGEFKWMREVDLTGIRYIGGEIVTAKIEKLRVDFPQHEWRVMDITEDPLPEVDMWQCRDTIFHFPHKYVKQTLQNFINSKIKYILISSHPDSENRDITEFGDFNFINFEKGPFNFPKPIAVIDDTAPGYPLKRNMIVYRKDYMARFDYFRT